MQQTAAKASAEFVVDDAVTVGVGFGTPMSGTFGTSATTTVTGSIPAVATAADCAGPIPPVDLHCLTSAKHTVFVRGVDTEGKWGVIGSVVLNLAKAGPQTTALSVSPRPANGKGAVTVSATGDDTAAGGTITAAEYFVGAAGTDGQGVPMSLNRVATKVAETGTIAATTVAALGEGTTQVWVHSRNSQNIWGPAVPVDLAVDVTAPAVNASTVGPNPTNAVVSSRSYPGYLVVSAELQDRDAANGLQSTVTAGEAFIDPTSTTPVFGKGLSLIAVDGAFDSPTEQVYGLIPLTQVRAMAPGEHKVYVHGKDAAGNWGSLTLDNALVRLLVDKTAPVLGALTGSPNPTNGAATLTLAAPVTEVVLPSYAGPRFQAAEYWTGTTDPGVGKGTRVQITDTGTGVSAAIPLGGLLPGTVTFSLRVQDAAGNWSNAVTTSVQVVRGNAIFSDTFDSGNLLAWTARTGAVAATAAAGIPAGGSNVGLAATLPGGGGNAPAYVTDDTPLNETGYHAQFSFNPNTLSTGPSTATWLTVFEGRTATGQAFAVQFQRVGTSATRQLRIVMSRNFGGPSMSTTPYTLGAGAHTVRVDWSQGTNGSLRLLVDNVLRDTRTGANTGAGMQVQSARLGITAGTLHRVDHGGHGLVRHLRLDPDQHSLTRPHPCRGHLPVTPAASSEGSPNEHHRHHPRPPGARPRRAAGRHDPTAPAPPAPCGPRRPHRPRRGRPRPRGRPVAARWWGRRAGRAAVDRDGDDAGRALLAGRGRRRRRPRHAQLRRARPRQGVTLPGRHQAPAPAAQRGPHRVDPAGVDHAPGPHQPGGRDVLLRLPEHRRRPAPRRGRDDRDQRAPPRARAGAVMRARSLRSALALVVAALALVVGGAAPASAHAYLASSSPADGTSLQDAPRVVELRFTEHVVLESTEVTITDTAGRRYAPRALTLAETDEDREAPATVVATLPALPVGAYHVAWRTLSSDDLHQSSGLLAFGVQDEVTAAGPSESAPDALETAGRWAVLSGLGLALGALLLCARPLARTPDPRTRARLRARLWRLARVGAALAASVALVVTVLDLARFGTSAFTTGYAVRWLGREAAFVAVVALLTPRAPAARSAARRERLALAAGLLAALLTVALGHVGLRGGVTWALAATAHLAAASAWTGAVACLALLVLRHRHDRGGRPVGELAPLLTGFRVPAVVAVVVVAVSGVYLASDVVVSVDAALVTGYGRILLAKLAVAALVGALALRTTRAVHDRRASAAVRPRVVVEAVGLSLVVALGALLASGQPAVSPRLVIADAPSRIDDRPVADLQQTVVLRPNRPGASVAVIDVLDTRRPSPGPVTGVTVGVGSAASQAGGAPGAPTPAPAAPVTRGRWAAGVTLPAQGPVEVRVTVHRRGLPDVVSTIRWVVGPDVADARVLVSKAPLAGPLTALAVVLALVAVAVALLFRRRSRRPIDRRSGHRPRPARRGLPGGGRRAGPAWRTRPRSGPPPEQAPEADAGDARLLGSRPD